jgi:hypothetical protein
MTESSRNLQVKGIKSPFLKGAGGFCTIDKKLEVKKDIKKR